MKRIINHVNSKPEHVRHLVAVGCTVVVGVVVLGFWLHSFQKTTYALLNPEEQTVDAPAYAGADSESLFSRLGSSFSDMRAQIGNLFSGSASIQTQSQPRESTGPVHPLPVSN